MASARCYTMISAPAMSCILRGVVLLLHHHPWMPMKQTRVLINPSSALSDIYWIRCKSLTIHGNSWSLVSGRVEPSATLNLLIDLDWGEILNAKQDKRCLERTVGSFGALLFPICFWYVIRAHQYSWPTLFKWVNHSVQLGMMLSSKACLSYWKQPTQHMNRFFQTPWHIFNTVQTDTLWKSRLPLIQLYGAMNYVMMPNLLFGYWFGGWCMLSPKAVPWLKFRLPYGPHLLIRGLTSEPASSLPLHLIQYTPLWMFCWVRLGTPCCMISIGQLMCLILIQNSFTRPFSVTYWTSSLLIWVQISWNGPRPTLCKSLRELPKFRHSPLHK